jgi:hypothetical protein
MIHKHKRRRGVILTSQGLEKLQDAKSEAEFQENGGHRYTLEALSERTTLAVDTLMKVFACEAGVDRQTLKCCFSAFNLLLESSDYYRPEPSPHSETQLGVESVVFTMEPELPEGQVPLGSAFYLERFPIEANCYKAIMQPGALIRIKAPRRMGKTSLMTRILYQAKKVDYCTVSLNFQLADREIFQSLDKFLQWFCATVSFEMQLPNRLADYWDDLFGSKISCKIYFEQYLLAETTQPLVLALDDIDRLFQYPDLADDFFGLLRAWHEEAKHRDQWKKLRLIVVHATEVYIPLNVNQSPFNVGVPIELPALTCVQVEHLAKLYQLDWSPQQVAQLMALVGGHPYLVRICLYQIWNLDIRPEELSLMESTSILKIYEEHLQQQAWNLQKNPELEKAFAQVIMSQSPVALQLIQAFKLQSLGLVHWQGNRATPSCQLYAQYFRSYFCQDNAEQSSSNGSKLLAQNAKN